MFAQNLEKPLALDRYLSYRTNLTFSGICQYLLALWVTFILLNEKLNAWSCQWSSYEDNTWSQNTINYLATAKLQNSRSPDDHAKNLFSLYSQFIETLCWKYLYPIIKLICSLLFNLPWFFFCKTLMRKSPLQQIPTISLQVCKVKFIRCLCFVILIILFLAINCIYLHFYILLIKYN